MSAIVTWIPVGPAARRTIGSFGNDELVDWLEGATTTGFDVGDRWETAVGALAEIDPALGSLTTGGDPLGPDLGPGPAHLLAPSEVVALAATLRALPVGVLPAPDQADDPSETPDLADDLAVICTGVRIAADGGRALLVVRT